MYKKVFSILSGNILYFGSIWFLLVFVAREYSIEHMGVIGLATAICAPIFSLLGLSPRQSIVTEVVKDGYSFGLLRKFFLIGITIIIGITSFYFVETKYYLLFILYCIFKCQESLYEYYYAVYTKEKKFNEISKSQLIRTFQVFFFIIATYITKSIEISVISILVFNFFILLKYKAKTAEGFVFNILELRKSLVISISAFLILIYLNVPRYFLSLEGFYNLGILAGLINIVTLARLLVQSVSQTMLPYLVSYTKSKDSNSFKKLYIKFSLLIIFAGLIGSGMISLLGSAPLVFIYGDDFEVKNIDIYLAVVYATVLCLAMLSNLAMTAMMKHVFQLWFSLLLLVLSLILSLWLVSTYLISGVLVSLIAVSFIQYLVLNYRILKELRHYEL